MLESCGRPLVVLVAAVLMSAVSPSAAADPIPGPPPPPPVLGPLQYGPVAYPPTMGIPLLPQARSGVTVGADAIAPDTGRSANQGSPGIVGVQTRADALAPVPKKSP